MTGLTNSGRKNLRHNRPETHSMTQPQNSCHSIPNIIEEIRTLPAGRGRVIQIINRKRIPQKRDRPKKKPFYFLHYRQSYTPSTVCILQYSNSRPIIFPEKLHMNEPDIKKLLTSALVLYNVHCSRIKHKTGTELSQQPLKKGENPRIRIDREVLVEVRKQLKRFDRWVKN